MHKKTKILFCYLFVVAFLSACQPVHTTQQYYKEYINPKAAIDYDFTYSLNLSEEYLDAYFQIDSSLTKLRDDLNYIEIPSREALINVDSLSQPWIKDMAFYDDSFFFIAGSQSLAMDNDIKEFLQMHVQRTETSFMAIIKDTCFFINTLKIGDDIFRTVVVELDIEELLKDIHLANFVLSVEKALIYGQQHTIMVDDIYDKAMRDKSLSGKVRYENKSQQWVRSLAADNLIYIFAG